MNAFFRAFFEKVKQTPHWKVMEQTVENSEWHREANVAVHTQMCIDFYLNTGAQYRSQRHQTLTLMTLLFHDFGKPEAEETVEKKDGSGTYRRYAGHEPVSANEFISFMCQHPELTEMFFDAGFDWRDVRKIKFMIENHLPYGLKNPTKRANLRRAVIDVLGDDEVCFYDQLWADCNGRISDNHDAKRQAVTEWVADFEALEPTKRLKEPAATAPTMFVLTGPVGVGKTTWKAQMEPFAILVSEDAYRHDFFVHNASSEELSLWMERDRKGKYAQAWQFCFNHRKEYDAYARSKLLEAVASGKRIVLDRTNQTRKSRAPWIQPARDAGYRISAVEMYISEATSLGRQQTRPDKEVPIDRVHSIYMAMETTWTGVEVHDSTVFAFLD